VLDVQNLSVVYDNQTRALQDVSLQMIEGQIVGIIGPNGAGKSTLIKAMINLIPQKDKHFLKSKPIHKQLKNLSYVEQKSNIDTTFPMKVLGLCHLGIYPQLKPWQLLGKKEKAMATEALNKVDMSEYKDRQIGELSGGQFQRVLIARTLVRKTDLILLDEPFVGIDITSENIIVDLLKELAESGKTILIVHHDLSKVSKYFDSLILLNKHLIDFGSVENVFTGDNLAQAFGTNILIPSESGDKND
jgi:manganese-transporting ATPase